MDSMASVQKFLSNPEYGAHYRSHPTAQQIIDREGLVGKLTGKVILITGASSGIGVETARALHSTGAHIFLAVRDLAKTEKVRQDILASSAGSGGQGQGAIDLLQLDLTSLDSVRQCAAAFLSQSRQLHVLVCNAGVMATPQGKTQDGFETQLGVNHVAHFLLFQLLRDALLHSSTASFNSRVVMLSSSGHEYSPVLFDDLDLSTRGYDPFVAYGQSKTANIYMALEIERRYGSRGLHSTALHPGGIITELARHLDESVVQRILTDEVAKIMKTAQQGAATTVWAAVSKEWEGEGGKYPDNVGVSKLKDESTVIGSGYVPYAYDADAAKRLWTESLRMVGMQEDGSSSA